MEGDLGWVPPQIHIHLDILRLWNRLVGLSMAESRLPKILYHHMLKKNNTWITEVKKFFTKINCTDVFNNNTKILNLKTFLNHAKDKLLNIHIDQWKINVGIKPKLHIYANIKQYYKRENYCHINMKRFQRSLIAKLRLGILAIRV